MSLLTVFGKTTGALVEGVTVAGVVAAFLIATWDALGKEWGRLAARTRVLYGVAIPATVGSLVIIGTVPRGDVELPRLPGTRNIAVIGFLAPDGSEQELYDDVAKTVAVQLRSSTGSDVHDYTPKITPPWKDLRAGDPDGDADAWALDFVHRTGAKLSLGGYGERDRGQTSVHITMYLAPGTFQNVPELGGWYPLSTLVFDSGLDGTSTRDELHKRLNDLVRGTTTFLSAVDALHSGRPDQAVTLLNALIAAPPPTGTQSFYELVALFRGHTHQALAARGTDPDAELARARADYLTIRSDSPIAMRARLSLAGNDYLVAVRRGCEQPSQDARALLTHAAETLRTIATDGRLPALARLTAKVNFAQVEQCRERANEPIDDAALQAFLNDIDAATVEDGSDDEIRDQIKALALSIDATRRARNGDYAGAVETIERALQHDARFERNALWEGLRFSWLLKECLLAEARTARDRSLKQLHLAAENGQLPVAQEDGDRTVFAGALASAEADCGARDSARRAPP